MNDNQNLTVVMPSFSSPELVACAIGSFKRFKPNWLDLEFIVVENSNDDSYKKNTECSGATWIQNPTQLRGSLANAHGLEVGLVNVRTEFVFMCHSDVMVTSELFFSTMFGLIDSGNSLVGTVLDPTRVNAIHISGLLTKTTLAKSVNLYPIWRDDVMMLDVGDTLTEFCRSMCLQHHCLRNTFNDEATVELLCEPYRSFHVDRALDEHNNVVFMHLGRGTEKTHGTYSKKGRILLNGWCNFYTNVIQQ